MVSWFFKPKKADPVREIPGATRVEEEKPAPSFGAAFQKINEDRFERDREALRFYWREKAKTWWKKGLRKEVYCDGCNRELAADEGFLIGSYLLCGNCCEKRLVYDYMVQASIEPDFFGRGALDEARKLFAKRRG